jgi:lysophospholipid acyltransferase (LPLAT)-like uncharacterized protein
MRAAALGVLLRLLGATWRVEVIGRQHLAATQQAGRAFVFALWHRTLVPLLWWHRRQGVTLLVSRHADGALVADPAVRMGYQVVRGSTTEGGSAALRGLIRALAAGQTVAVTPDGPRGPAGVVKPGVLAAAGRAHAAILPVAAGASSTWEIRSWDRLLIPRPFARVRIAYGPALEPSLRPTSESAARELAVRLDAACALAEPGR